MRFPRRPFQVFAAWVALAAVTWALMVAVSLVRDQPDERESGGGDMPTDHPAGNDSVPVPQEPPRRTFTLAFTGDVLVHSTVTRQARAYGAAAGGYDYRPMFAAVRP